MKKMTIILYNDYAMIENGRYDKDEVFRYITKQRYKSKIRNVFVKYNENYNSYTLLCDKNIFEVVFPKIFDNKEYEKNVQRWYRQDKKSEKRHLLICTLALTGILSCVATVASCKNSNTSEKPLNEFTFYLDSIDEFFAIKELETEIYAHTGYGEIEGYRQTIEEHKNSACSLGTNVDFDEVIDMIEKYCEKKELGNEVAKAAEERYKLLLEDEVKKAHEIKLFKIYKDEKLKK